VPDIAIDNKARSLLNRVPGLNVLSLLIKALIAVISIGFIYHQIFYQKHIAEIQVFASRIFDSYLDIAILATVVLMMLVNWSLESAKWRFLITKIESISFFRALKAIFSGASVSVFTPNRIGDFGARVIYLDNSDRVQAVFITLIGSISQLVVTILFGFVGMGYYILTIYSGTIDPVLAYALFGVLSLSTTLTLIAYYNVSTITRWAKTVFRLKGVLKKRKIRNRLKGYVEVFSLYTIEELSLTLLYSLLRYIVFSVQFYLLLFAFDVNIPIATAFALISLTFFTMAVIPTVALTEIGVRGSVALFFLNIASENALGIVTATFVLWIINLAIPALIGSLFVFSANIFKVDKR